MTHAHCLLIEEDEAARQQRARLLGSFGLHVVTSRDYDEALLVYPEERPKLIITSRNVTSRFVYLVNQMALPLKPTILYCGTRLNTDIIAHYVLNGISEFLFYPFDRDIMRFKLRQAGLRLPEPLGKTVQTIIRHHPSHKPLNSYTAIATHRALVRG